MQDGLKRREIVEHAFNVFYDQGFSLGIDALMANTGISKRTLYKYFPSKENLVVTLIDHYRETAIQGLRRAVEGRSPDPKGRLRSLFEVRQGFVADGERRGCFAIDALVEYRGRHPDIEAAADTMIAALRAYIAELCEATGLADPASLAEEAFLLFQGAVVASQTLRSQRPFDVAIAILDKITAS